MNDSPETIIEPQPEVPNPYEQPSETPTEDHAENTRKARRAYGRTICNIAIFSVAATLFAYLILFIGTLIFGKPIEEFSTNEHYGCTFFAMYAIAFPLYLLISKPMEKAPPQPQKCSFGKLLLYWLIAYSTSIVFNMIGTFLTMFVAIFSGFNASDYTVATKIVGDRSWVVTVAAVVGAPIIEELIMRKVFIDRVRKYGEIKAMLMSGILFGLLHGNFTQLFYTAPMGMVLAYVYMRTGKIRNTIFIHCITNILGSVVPQFLFRNIDFNAYLEAVQNMDSTYLMEHMSEYFPLLVWVGIILCVVIGGAITTIVLLASKKMHFDAPEAPINKGKHFSVSVLNYGMLLMLVVSAVDFVRSVL